LNSYILKPFKALDICHYFLSPVYTTTFSARQIFGHGKIEFWHGTARLYLISFRAVPKISVRAEHGKVLRMLSQKQHGGTN
jgi:hypothetical protein